ncbi:15-hydroxyprostaglandin dehydrogenase [NAD(+)]-like [Stegodyphus dumicola]|uniref:15-hydroxyprostaglandin dehydrogenase [NAD(+)]-like n=1 Tax=Stegodyphus dumicola TaxID=202533 RepID=UPI0015ABFA57|nr:15-hydroxyprostaglandin dehydrogenase [NAD(+)]-like [Stegodyphus dumicola]
MKLNGKVGMVTGGAKGIGKAFCNALLNEGMKVSICDINENVGKNFHEDILEGQKSKVIFCKCDVSSESEFRAAFDKTIKTFGRIDLLINNAGILNEHEWKRVIDVNFVSTLKLHMYCF